MYSVLPRQVSSRPTRGSQDCYHFPPHAYPLFLSDMPHPSCGAWRHRPTVAASRTRCRSPNRLSERASQAVTPSDGRTANEQDTDSRNGDDDPRDPGKGLGGHVLVAVDEARVGAVLSAVVGSGNRRGSGRPEDPSGVSGYVYRKCSRSRQDEPGGVRGDRGEEGEGAGQEGADVDGGEEEGPPRDEDEEAEPVTGRAGRVVVVAVVLRHCG